MWVSGGVADCRPEEFTRKEDSSEDEEEERQKAEEETDSA